VCHCKQQLARHVCIMESILVDGGKGEIDYSRAVGVTSLVELCGWLMSLSCDARLHTSSC